MLNLHIISSLIETLVLKEMMNDAINQHDTVVLCGEAVFSHPLSLENLMQQCSVVALSDELGGYHARLPPHLSTINFSQWATLIANAHVVNHWV